MFYIRPIKFYVSVGKFYIPTTLGINLGQKWRKRVYVENRKRGEQFSRFRTK